jgi:hypothetical protein
MAERKETRPVTREEERTVAVTCDLCGKQAPRPEGHHGVWADGYHDVAEVTVQVRVGDSFPEGGNVQVREFDICPDCFDGKLIPWMEGQGAQVREEGRDW